MTWSEPLDILRVGRLGKFMKHTNGSRIRRYAAAPEELAGNAASALPHYYEALFSALGPRNWWPAKTPFEVIVGAILTQNTSWVNVERAIENLRREGMLSVRSIVRAPLGKLEHLVRPSGYFRQKARNLKAFAQFLRASFGGSLTRMFRAPVPELREKLLAVRGIGPETADSILLYAGRHPVFVVDAYTRRILERHALIPGGRLTYEEIRSVFETSLPRDTQLYNEFHALIVDVGKKWCRKKNPRCEECPLRPFLPVEKAVLAPEISPAVEALP